MYVYESDISYEGQMNRTQQEYNLLGQRVVCQYIYIDFESLYEVKYKLEWTLSNVKGARQKRTNERNEKTNLDETSYSYCYYLKLIHI